MSKKHKYNKQNVQQEAVALAAQAAAAVASDAPATEPVVEPESIDATPPAGEVEDLLAPEVDAVETAETPVAEEAAADKEPEDTPEEAVAPAQPEKVVEEVKAEPVPEVKVEQPVAKTASAEAPKGKVVMAEDVYPSRTPQMVMHGIPPKHTAAGERLIKFFDEYDEMIAANDPGKIDTKKRVMKLFQVVQAACPGTGMPQAVANDLVRIVFDRFMANWGRLYNEGTLFQLDYTLPGGPVAIDKLNMFCTAMIQLVDAARESKRVMFNDERLNMILKNASIFNAITGLRKGIERRIASEQGL